MSSFLRLGGACRRTLFAAPVFAALLSSSASAQLPPEQALETRTALPRDTKAAGSPAADKAEGSAKANEETSDGSSDAKPAEKGTEGAAEPATAGGAAEGTAQGGTTAGAAASGATAPTGASTASGSAGASGTAPAGVASGTEEVAASEGEAVEQKPAPAAGTPAVKGEAKDEPQPKVDYSSLPWTYHQKHIDLMVGLAINRTADTALIPFLEAPVLAEGSVRAGGVFLSKGHFALAGLAEFGGSQGGSYARSLDTKIHFLHVTAGLEPRYHLHPRLYLYGRVMGGTEYSRAELGYEQSSELLSDSGWVFQLDGNVGAAVRLAGSPDGRKRTPRLWAFLEGGYRFTTDHKAEFEADADDAPARPQSLEIEPYSTRGIRGSIGLMTSF